MTRGEQLDLDDPLAHFRNRFLVDDQSPIYLDGNSLGRLPLAAAERLSQAVEAEWGERLVRGWGEGWIQTPRRLGDKIGRLIGARAGETLVCDSTSVNFFKLVTAALAARPGRRRIVTDNLNFPSDLYLLQGIVEVLGGRHEIEVVKSEDGIHGADILSALDSDTALVTLSHTDFKSGFIYDMEEISAAAHRAGALVLWDLSHSVGSVPVDLHMANADLAVGCTYKYLNGGPGAPAFLYVREERQDLLRSPIWGWFGHRNAFDFGLDYVPAPGIDRFMAGTPPILSMISAEAGVDLLLEAGMEAIRAKSLAMTEFMVRLWRESLEPHGVTLNSPTDATRRGSHISLGYADGLRVDRALIEEMSVIPDFRAPDNIRLGVAPLYTTFSEIENAMARFAQVLQEGLYLKYPIGSMTVT